MRKLIDDINVIMNGLSNNKRRLVLVDNHIGARFNLISKDFKEQFIEDITNGDESIVDNLGWIGNLMDEH